MTLNHTLQKILDINHGRKGLPYIENARQRQEAWEEELKLLNKIAACQARLIQHYEERLGNRG